MTYSILITEKGIPLKTIEGIEAPDALSAIDYVEQQFKQPDDESWTGLEFQARQLDFTLS